MITQAQFREYGQLMDQEAMIGVARPPISHPGAKQAIRPDAKRTEHGCRMARTPLISME